MEKGEYATMYRLEDTFWWYRALRAMLTMGLERAGWAGLGCEDPGALRILDVGCGTGATLKHIQGAILPGSNPCGIDFSDEAVHFCRRRGLSMALVASGSALPFPGDHFDLAISLDVICHKGIPDKGAPLREIRRVLKPGGLLVLNLPAYQWLFSSHDLRVYTDHRFTRGEVVGLLRRNALAPVMSTYWNSVLFPGMLAVRLLRKMLPSEQSDLQEPHPLMHRLYSAVLAAERGFIRRCPMPFGLSIMVAACKEPG